MNIYDLITMFPSQGVQEFEFQANGTDNSLDTGIMPNQDTRMKVFGRFYFDNQYLGIFSSGQSYLFGQPNQGWRVWFNNSQFNTGSTIDTDYHWFEIKNKKFYVDDVETLDMTSVADFQATTKTIDLMGLDDSSRTRFDIRYAEIEHMGTTYIWNFNEGTGNVIQDNFSTNYTIQGTVNQSQWVSI